MDTVCKCMRICICLCIPSPLWMWWAWGANSGMGVNTRHGTIIGPYYVYIYIYIYVLHLCLCVSHAGSLKLSPFFLRTFFALKPVAVIEVLAWWCSANPSSDHPLPVWPRILGPMEFQWKLKTFGVFKVKLGVLWSHFQISQDLVLRRRSRHGSRGQRQYGGCLDKFWGMSESNRWKTVQDNERASFFTVLCSPVFLILQCSMRFSAGFMAFTCAVCMPCRLACHCFEADSATDMLEVPDDARRADADVDSSVAGGKWCSDSFTHAFCTLFFNWCFNFFNFPLCICFLLIIEGSLEVKLPTMWTDGKAEVRRVQEEKKRSEKIREEKEREERRCRCTKR